MIRRVVQDVPSPHHIDSWDMTSVRGRTIARCSPHERNGRMRDDGNSVSSQFEETSRLRIWNTPRRVTPFTVASFCVTQSNGNTDDD